MTFDKEAAREKFIEDNPQWAASLKRQKAVQFSEHNLLKIIELYPDTPNSVISEMLGIPTTTLYNAVGYLRKRGVEMKKNKDERSIFDNAFKILKEKGLIKLNEDRK